ncbi:MAG: ferrochelatase [Wenzhouxiangella sp.]
MADKSEALIESVEQAGQVGAHRQSPRTGVLLVNLGTPDAPTAPALRRYLREFLSDRRVVEAPRAIWWPILYGIILPFRSPRSAGAYRRVWTEHGSPLLTVSRSLAGSLERELRTTSPQISVLLAMTYGRPSIDQAIDRLRRENIQRLLVVPLYPQYSATTTASVFDRVTDSLKRMRWLPETRFVNDYHNEAAWLDAVSASISDFRSRHDRAEKLVFSFHGIPKRNLPAGDPYYCQCQASARRIAERLELDDAEWLVTFQSRLGRAEWLKPYTDQTLKQLASDGIGTVQVVCPGFAVDCLETLDEIANENREEFLHAGGKSLDYIPCLNDSDVHVKVLADLCRRHGQGWPEFAGARAVAESELARRPARAERAARQLGLE